MRAAILFAPLVLLPGSVPAQAAAFDPSVVAHGWGYAHEDDGVYTSRGICDAVAVGVAVETSVTCYMANAIGDVPASVTVTGSSPGVALATLEVVTEDRGMWCWSAKSVFADGTVVYYPSRNHYECAPL